MIWSYSESLGGRLMVKQGAEQRLDNRFAHPLRL